MDKNDDILIQAARAATAKMPALEAERLKLTKELQDVSAKITKYKAIISGADLDNVPNAAPAPRIEVPESKSPKGKCMADIDKVLENNRMSASEIQKEINQKFGVLYGFSTVHGNLKRGEMLNRYQNDDGKWSKMEP